MCVFGAGGATGDGVASGLRTEDEKGQGQELLARTSRVGVRKREEFPGQRGRCRRAAQVLLGP